VVKRQLGTMWCSWITIFFINLGLIYHRFKDVKQGFEIRKVFKKLSVVAVKGDDLSYPIFAGAIP
jgi:hypothetical protein